MTVYVVRSGYYHEGESIVAICATRDIARARALAIVSQRGWRDDGDLARELWEKGIAYVEIEEYPVDCAAREDRHA